MKKNKKVMAVCLAGAMLITGLFVTTDFVKAAESSGSAIEVQDSIQYIKNSELSESEQIDNMFGETAPTMDGYFFGGWYEEIEGEKQPLKTVEQKDAATGEIYAKFVPVHVMSVKAQNHSGTKNTDDQSGSTSTRVVSAVDSLDYSQVGFEVWLGDTLIGKQETKDVYSNLIVTKEVNGETKKSTYQANSVFGQAAAKFIVLRLDNVGENLWSKDIYVRPYWKTFDGVTVTGLAKYVYVQDGIDGWISVPVNLHAGVDVTAGLVNVSFDSTRLQYKGFSAGRVFDEVEANADGAIVKCAGNNSELENVSANDMYITLRFELLTDYEIGNGTEFLNFTMSGINFANIDENYVSMDILNIQY